MTAGALEDERIEDRIGALLVERGLLGVDAVERARRLQATSGERFERLVTRLGLAPERDLAQALADLSGAPLVAPRAYPDRPILDGAISVRFLKQACVLPIAEEPEGVVLAMAFPHDAYARDAVAAAAGRPALPRVAPASEIEAAIERLYGDVAPAQSTADEGDVGLEIDIERLKDQASEAPVVRLVNQLIVRAVEARASDIHIEPFENRLRVRYRIDGALREIEPPPSGLRAAVASRIKILARLDIAERRLPQDGRAKLVVHGAPIDLRVSTMPTLHGESVVLRILDGDRRVLDFPALGLGGAALDRYLGALEKPNGVFLVTGPTGSGKTTTLYASLLKLNDAEKKVVTIEDPVEYQIEGVNQIQVSPAVDFTFAAALRSILRQDPDVILVGEIRDVETAQIAVQAALTGHLVLSTLHTNDAVSAVARLLDMGVEDYLIASTVNGVAAQRLVRRLCPQCRESYAPSSEAARRLGLEGERIVLHRPRGCGECGGTGFRGRLSVLETMFMSDRLRQLVLGRASAQELRRVAVEDGMRTMFEDGMAKALAGDTTVEEILRVTRDV